MKKTLDSSYGRQKTGTSGSGKTALVLSGGGSRAPISAVHGEL